MEGGQEEFLARKNCRAVRRNVPVTWATQTPSYPPIPKHFHQPVWLLTLTLTLPQVRYSSGRASLAPN
jgi:hypothetical protein